VRETVDPKTKQRIFKFIDVRPSGKLLGLQFNGRGLYATATISIEASPRSRLSMMKLVEVGAGVRSTHIEVRRSDDLAAALAATRPANRKRRDRDGFVD
jgi:hypothetical protein